MTRCRRAGFRLLLLLASLAPAGLSQPAAARPDSPILHEFIPPDPSEDLALDVALDGDLPAALRTSSGIVSAPDPRQLPRPSESTYGPTADHDTFTPDRETRRPDVNGYDDPFTPSTAPFKRLDAFDGVRGDYKLYVHDEHLAQVATGASQGPDDEAFFADLVVDVEADRRVRIPSVGPGARIVRTRLGVGKDDMPVRVMRDGADNWFLQAFRPRGAAIRARLVMQVVIARAAFGGQLADPAWSDLPSVPALPDNVGREAAAVRSAIGVNRRMRPRQAIAKLVQYFRGFADSDEPPRGRGSIYLDLALSKKGVCRHRAFAFFVTALGLGIPTRMILNEAHAWVEVHDGTLWRRIDLGGAGRITAEASGALADRRAYEPPPDPFTWPQNARRGADMVTDARSRWGSAGPASSSLGSSGGSPTSSNSIVAQDMDPSASQPASGSSPATASPSGVFAPSVNDDHPASSLTVAVTGAEAYCGRPLWITGSVRAEAEPCPHVAVELWLRAAATQKSFLLGTLATGDDGAFAGGIVVPTEAPPGDYDVIARTPGDARCGAGSSSE